MKTTSIFALATALALCVPSFAYAQDASATTTATGAASAATDAAAGVAGSTTSGAADATVNLDSNNDGNVSADEQAAGDASSSTSISVDANADGTISVDEIGTIDAELTAGGDAAGSIDTDGNGTISEEELANANTRLANLGTLTESLSCESGIEASIAAMGELDMVALTTAMNVTVVPIADCEEADVTAALATENAASVRTGLEANAAAVAAVQARGATLADVVGASGSGDSITVYVTDTQN